MGKYDPEATRENLVRAAFDEVYETGMRAASIDGILSRAGVTKGALYHHFSNKNALCSAMLDDVIRPMVRQTWIDPLRNAQDPIAVLQRILSERLASVDEDQVRCGCPLNNLAQEMSAVDEEFRAHLGSIYREWRAGIADALVGGQTAGTVRDDIDVKKTALFIISTMEGAMGMAKNARSPEVLKDAGEVLSRFLDTLRTPN